MQVIYNKDFLFIQRSPISKFGCHNLKPRSAKQNRCSVAFSLAYLRSKEHKTKPNPQGNVLGNVATLYILPDNLPVAMIIR